VARVLTRNLLVSAAETVDSTLFRNQPSRFTDGWRKTSRLRLREIHLQSACH